MGILNRLLNWISNQPDYSDPDELKAIWNSYSDQWPDNNERYGFWKPASVLPAPKYAIKRAMKLAHAQWPEPIDSTVFSAFFMEFVDLALHLTQEKYDAIENFRKQRIMCCGEVNKHDPLLMFRLCSASAYCLSIEDIEQNIINVRDRLQRSKVWDPVDIDNCELDNIRRIVMESTLEFATLIQEWRFYILSKTRKSEDTIAGKKE